MTLSPNSDLSNQVQRLIDTHVREVKSDLLCDRPIVTACILTYNHKEFIEQAIEGALIQQIDFPYEILIGDDYSTDGTTEIIRKYQSQYPDKIRLLVTDRNLYKPLPEVVLGLMGIALLQSCHGKYIALCEGDDYWTDPLKLQKQVDFLEANSDFAICFHNAAIINECCPENNRLNNDDSTLEVSTLDNLIQEGNYITTASVVIKKELIENLPDWFTSLPFGDYPLYLIAARNGNIRYINKTMSVYRIHEGGIHGKLTNSYEGLTIAYQQHYQFWLIINKSGIISKSQTTPAILRAIENVIDSSLRSKQAKVYLLYNYLLLVHSRGGSWKVAVSNIVRLYMIVNRKIRDNLLKKSINLL
ncbi:glycosyltransferase [Chamaesiphon polymorphus]|uniref:Glycosyltransferase 2-like domain-containing protein n=1 Tax=Chamaesiphon polymorphus CCALA 037 TaxID=2107692 RepID=A0A2T1GCX1_9CYAN|nr:glycosyltransferase [Chamaesiphon polymorphus]PSB55165.1 hypothetical protein C7B77_15870 [Chamaesiphon polymorphus CCALA 037]